MQSSLMFSGSPKNVALGRIALALMLSFLGGMFFIEGFGGALRGDLASWVQLLLSPILVGIASLHGWLLWKATP